MSIENNLERIADALEAIAKSGKPLDAVTSQPVAGTVAPAVTPAAPKQDAAAAVAPPPVQASAPAPAPSATAPAPAPSAAAPGMTMEQLDAALKGEMTRIGDSAPIRNKMTEFGVSSLNDLPVEKYSELLAAVKAL